MTDRPNIVLICADQQRMDSLACYGNKFTVSPNLDRLARSGVRFSRAFTPWPVCTPARGTMWTGVYPHAHGLIDNVYGVDNAFDSVARIKRTVFDAVRERGYRTAHFGKWHLGEVRPPFFDVWEESFNSRRGHWIDGKLDGIYRPDRQTEAMIRFLRAEAGSDRPFLAVQGYYPPHDPYTAPKRFYEPYRGRGVPFAGYYAAVTALDHDVGLILDTLDQTGLARNTLVVYFADHGDTFWYRREGEHKFVCHDDAIMIPMLVAGPGAAAGAVQSAPVGLQDLVATVIDYAGAPADPALHGRSMRPLIEGKATAWRGDYYVQNVTHVSAIEQRCLRSDGWKLIAAANGAHELYNLVEDPEEELDVFLTPRPDGGFERYKHYPDFAPVIADLAGRMRDTARGLHDERGVELADAVFAAISGRLTR
jgi:arylsulfatase A-like enzyme